MNGAEIMRGTQIISKRWRSRLSRRSGVVLAATLVLALVAQTTPAMAVVSATAPVVPAHLTPKRESSVPGHAVKAAAAVQNDRIAQAAARPLPTVVWPAPGVAETDVPVGSAARRIGTSPVYVAAAARGGVRSAAGAAPGRVRVQVLDRSAATRAGQQGLLLTVGRADGRSTGGEVTVSVDYSGFAGAYGADWAARLRLVQLPACALSTPQASACQGSVLASGNDARTHRVSAQVPVGAAASVGAAPASGSGVTVLAVTAGPSGSAGDFTATSLSPASSWSAGASSGDFSWSYPMRTPPGLGGPTPAVALSYSAQSVDGHTAASNNQPSAFGEGFDYDPGHIERRYKACADDMTTPGANNANKTGDLCWGPDNASLLLGGHATDLIQDGSGTWHPVSEDGSRIAHVTSGGLDYWQVTTTDGTQYFFGRERLQGWTSGQPVTSSLWKVPVFGNNPNEPCNATTFDASVCDQPWRWNLDYVVDKHGNTMSYWYAKETNRYGRNLDPNKASAYTRGGWLGHIDYGTDIRTSVGGVPTDTLYRLADHHPPAKVEFGAADRCLSSCATHGTNWPDTPWDQDCAVVACTNQFSPTFWTALRLGSIKTRVWGGTAFRDVESWTFTHSFPDPGDGTRAGLWLASISHAGLLGAAVGPPAITFDGVQENNRVDGAEGYFAMNWWRIFKITTETGAVINVNYSGKQCVAGSPPPASEANDRRCFPVYWTPPDKTDPILDWFHKYVVTSVVVNDKTGATPTYSNSVTTRYTYPNAPAWRHVVDDGITPTKRQSWAVWRGYDLVGVTTGDPGEQTYAETRYLRGLDGDQIAAGGTRSVSVDDTQGNHVTDSDEYAGTPLVQTVYNGPGGAVVSKSVATPWRSTAKATRTIGVSTITARYVRQAAIDTYTTVDGAAQPRHTRTSTTFNDADGTTVIGYDAGDLADATDDQCTTPTYAPANTSVWLKGLVQRSVTIAKPCGQNPAAASDVLDDTRYSFDTHTYGTAPSLGDVTQTETLSSWSAGTSSYVAQSKAGYDTAGSGRVTSTTDLLGNTTTTVYSLVSTGGISQTTATGPLGSVITDLEPAWGLPLGTTDVNTRRTDLGYDAMGRLTGVWLPGRTKGTDSANTTYAYNLSNTVPTSVTTSKILPDGINYLTSYTLYDSLLRPRQTQAPAAPSSGRIVTDTFYDTAGRAFKSYGSYWEETTAPGTTLFAPAGEGAVTTVTRNVYDGAGRTTASILTSKNVEKWRTTTVYHGDRIDTTPPAGGTPTTTISDVKGRTTELRQYQGATPAGGYNATSYTYDPAGHLARVTDPAGNQWAYTYDIRGRLTQTNDPDRGTSTSSYNARDLKTSTTDIRNKPLAYVYDSLGRLIETHDDTATGAKRTSFVYDTIAKGILASSSRWAGTDEYKTAVTALDIAYRPKTTVYTIPAVEGALAGTYTFSASYNSAGSPSSVVMPGKGDLGQETVTYTYDVQGRPDGGSAVADTQYSPFGEPTLVTFGAGQRLTEYEEGTRRLTRTLSVRNTPAGVSGLVSDLHYAYDAAGLITKINEATQAGTDNQCLSYDQLQRLTEAWTPSSGDCTTTPSADGLGGTAPYWQTWTFDTVGNRLTQVDHGTNSGDRTTNYTYPTARSSQPHTLTSTSTTDTTGTRTAAYGYDAAGNTTSRPGATAQQNLAWDREGHLTIDTEATSTTSYLYDANGERLIRRNPGATTLYLPNQEVRLTTGAATPTTTRYYTHLGQTIATRTAAGVVWLIGDHQGTTTATVNISNQAVAQRDQTPYGALRGTATGTWPVSMDKGFVGGTQDTTGLTHLGAREYDPATGRFISVDPVQDMNDPQQWNGYSYANNSPISSSDPSGLWVGCGHLTPCGSSNPNPTPGAGGGGSSSGGGGGVCGLPGHCGNDAGSTSTGSKSRSQSELRAQLKKQLIADIDNALDNDLHGIPGANSKIGEHCRIDVAWCAAQKIALLGGDDPFVVVNKIYCDRSIACNEDRGIAPHLPSLGEALNPVVGDLLLLILIPVGAESVVLRTAVRKAEAVDAEAAAATDLRPLGRGSTGRTVPNNLNEKLAMESAMSDPSAGQIVPLRRGMTDSRWPGTEGWVKMTQNINGTEIHYVMNRYTGAIDDFKFAVG
jgi:RHS repeat-associated protein